MPTHYPGTPRERLALDTYIKLARAGAAVDARVNRPLAEHGLTVSQFGVLEALWHLGPLSQRQLGRKILKSSGNVTTVIDNLCRLGLVTRGADPGDRRVRRVALTDAGRRRVAEVLPDHVARVVRALAALDADEQATVARLLRKLGHANAPAIEAATSEAPVATPDSRASHDAPTDPDARGLAPDDHAVARR
jgi:MarR family transcriptional regulator, 2-MHQ and catechol-resistance regulon repressor